MVIKKNNLAISVKRYVAQTPGQVYPGGKLKCENVI